ncbi:MAG: HlyD family efflux transporter periplasmic adaptor subunit [Candidatus Omnitrophota bacterium]|nr:HlyD family efflux transporter periplasmic adaptor subunit [Candidatus Omnitrophota bacterium]
MKNKKSKFLLIMAIIIGLGVFFIMKFKGNSAPIEITTEINPAVGAIEEVISTTGTVLPKNRLEIKPPVNGRVDSILVKEGQIVKTGQTLAWMSSTERAALLDAARGQSEEVLKYWQDAYKAIPLLAPIDADVIVATTQPGQTVTTADAVIVLSDHLIVRAQVDETDIGKIKENEKSIISLDAYPNTKIKATVEHIYHESQTINNVTIYQVDLVPEEVPAFFRSGMNATVNFIAQSKTDALIVPMDAIHKEKDESYVLVKEGFGKEPVKRLVKIGISDDKNSEILSGLSVTDKIIIKTKKFVLPTGATGRNPFMPSRAPAQQRR